MIQQIQYASVTVTDIEQAKDFYVNKLGFLLFVETPLPGNNKFIMLKTSTGETNLVFSLPIPGREHIPSFSIAFLSDNLEKTFSELSAKGVVFSIPPTKTPWGGYEALFNDPFGNTYVIHEG